MSLFGNSGGSAFGGSGSSGTSLFGNSSGAESRKGGNSQGGSSMFGGSSGSKRGSSLFGGGGSGSLFSGGERNSGNVSAFMTAKVDFKDLDSNKKSDLLKLESLIQMQIRMITDLEEHFKARKAQKDQLYKQGMSDLSREITMLGSSISQTTNEVQGFDRKVRHEVRKKDMASHLLYKIQDKSVNKLQARLQLPSGYFIHKIKDFRTSMQQLDEQIQELDRFVHSALHSNDVGSPLALKETLRRQHDALINITGKVASVTAIMNDLRNRYRTYRVKYHNDTSDPFEVKKPPLMISDEPLWQNVQTKASSQSNGSSLFGGGSGGTSLFGGNKSGSAFGSGSGTSLFGNSSGSGTSLFGNSSGSGTSLFGNSSGSSGGGSGGGGSSGGLFGSSGSGGGSSIFGGSSGSGGGGGSLFGSGGSGGSGGSIFGGSGSGGTSLFGGGDFGSKKR